LDVHLAKLTAGQYASLWHSERAAAAGNGGGSVNSSSTMNGGGASFRPCALNSYYRHR
jgi:hypothetical protein